MDYYFVTLTQSNTTVMDLATRKYNFIQELVNLDKESIMDTLESVLKRAKEEYQDISSDQKKELDARFESYQNNPENVVDWNEIKENW